MDPYATIRLLLEAIAEQDWASAHQALQSLEEWGHKGGFIPVKLLETMSKITGVGGQDKC